jgi:hypothetical protein
MTAVDADISREDCERPERLAESGRGFGSPCAFSTSTTGSKATRRRSSEASTGLLE